jgi:hypothetical protein
MIGFVCGVVGGFIIGFGVCALFVISKCERK